MEIRREAGDRNHSDDVAEVPPEAVGCGEDGEDAKQGYRLPALSGCLDRGGEGAASAHQKRGDCRARRCVAVQPACAKLAAITRVIVM